MAKRESIWKANDGTEHRSKQSAAVADAEHAVRNLVTNRGVAVGELAGDHVINAQELLDGADDFGAALDVLIKARAALAKHEAKGEK